MVRPVTKDGFKKTRLPQETYEWLRAWYLAELSAANMETEEDGGPCMNQLAAPTIMTHLPPHLKDRLSDELYPVLHGWYTGNSYYQGEPLPLDAVRPDNPKQRMESWTSRNVGDLELTSIYGVRRYTEGAVLRMHADTSNTHVVSAIINVNQEEMQHDWPLLILDHQHREHNVSMQPGDMVLYESAKLLHGRPSNSLHACPFYCVLYCDCRVCFACSVLTREGL